jgi:D-alanyl-D-alanine carboxypeptidase
MIGTLIGALAVLAMSNPSDAEAALKTLPTAKTVDARPVPPKKVRTQSFGVKTSAECAFVADVASGAVLYAKDPHRVVPIASLTKLVTAMTFLDMHPDLSKTITVAEEDQDLETKRVFQTGDVITYQDVFNSMLVGSVNTSANIIAHTTLGREKFVAAMNDKVQKLNLKSPHFVDPSGLDSDNQANAADVAAILSTALSYPEIRAATEQSQVTVHGKIKDYSIKSTNMLMGSYLNQKPYGIVAAKTGSLPAIGFNMAQVTRNATGHQVVAVELGSDDTFSRFQDIKALTSWAFDTYQWD